MTKKSEVFFGIDFFDSFDAAVQGLFYHYKKNNIGIHNSSETYFLVVFNPRIRDGLETLVKAGQLCKELGVENFDKIKEVHQDTFHCLRVNESYEFSPEEMASTVAFKFTELDLFMIINDFKDLKLCRHFGQHRDQVFLGASFELWKNMVEFETIQTLNAFGPVHLMNLDLEGLVDAECKAHQFIEETAGLEAIYEEHWPKPLFQLMKLLRQDPESRDRIKAIEDQKFGGSIWTWRSTSSSSTPDVRDEITKTVDEVDRIIKGFKEILKIEE